MQCCQFAFVCMYIYIYLSHFNCVGTVSVVLSPDFEPRTVQLMPLLKLTRNKYTVYLIIHTSQLAIAFLHSDLQGFGLTQFGLSKVYCIWMECLIIFICLCLYLRHGIIVC